MHVKSIRTVRTSQLSYNPRLSYTLGGTREVCEGLLCALQNHPELGAKIAEVTASYAKEGRSTEVQCAM